MEILQFIVEYAQGNPGAATFIAQLFNYDDDILGAIDIMSKIERCDIKGTNLSVLYSDLANKDMKIVIEICNKVPDAVLIDACNRQDYSGRELIKSYINGYSTGVDTIKDGTYNEI